MKVFFYIFLLICVSCVPSNPVVQPGKSRTPPSSPVPVPVPLPPNHPIAPPENTVESLIPTYSSRNFNEMIQIFSKVTGVHPSRADIRDAISKVRTQLPLSFDPVSYNTFNQISLTSLAIQYCSTFVDENANADGTIVLGIPQTDATWADKVALSMVNRFSSTEVSEDPFLLLVLPEMVNVMKENNGIIIVEQDTYKKRIAMGCTMFLASSYFSFD